MRHTYRDKKDSENIVRFEVGDKVLVVFCGTPATVVLATEQDVVVQLYGSYGKSGQFTFGSHELALDTRNRELDNI